MTSDNSDKTDEVPLLKVLLKSRHLQTYSAFTREYRKVAGKIDRALATTEPSKAQFYRWLSGELINMPHSQHCRVLETMFPDWSVEQLFQPYSGSIDFVPNPGATVPVPTPSPATSTPVRQASTRNAIGHELDLSGAWWASWQTSKDGVEVITAQEVQLHQQGDQIEVKTTTRGITVEDGGYHWHGEMRLQDNEILMGWYSAADGAVRSKGTMYFVLHPHGVTMKGRWVGTSYDGKIMTGWGAMGRSEEEVRNLIEQLKGEGK